MSTILENGDVRFGNGSVQNVSQLSNYAYTYSNNLSLGRNSYYTVGSNVQAGPQGNIFVFVKSPWTCTEDNGLTIQYVTLQTSSDSVNWNSIIQQYQYANGFRSRYTAGNFSMSYPITGLSSGQTYWFRILISTGNASTTFSPTIMAYGV